MSSAKVPKFMDASMMPHIGYQSSGGFERDPKSWCFTLARYKFVAKMLDGYKSVLEVGCGDGFGATLVAQAVQRLVAIETDPVTLEKISSNRWLREKVDFIDEDIIKKPYSEKFDAVYSIDVIEHISPDQENAFLRNIALSTKESGVLIVGTPNETASAYASPISAQEHINLKSYNSLKDSISKYYHNVFMFGLNDEVLHTGFGPMCHYLMALAVQPRKL